MLIDHDKTFLEAARTLAIDGARIVVCLSAWPAENQIVWVSANQTGTMGGLRFLGQSKVVGPGGEILARTWAKAGLAVADIDVDTAVDRARLVLHHLDERRPDLYRDHSERQPL